MPLSEIYVAGRILPQGGGLEALGPLGEGWGQLDSDAPGRWFEGRRFHSRHIAPPRAIALAVTTD